MCDTKCVCSWTHTIGLLMCFLRGISSLRSDTALTDAEFALTDAEFAYDVCPLARCDNYEKRMCYIECALLRSPTL